MKDLITGFGDQLRHALEIGANTSLKENTNKIESVLIEGDIPDDKDIKDTISTWNELLDQ